MNVPHQGFIVAGKFCRGNQRGGGKVVNAVERDRVRALQLMVQAKPLALKDEDHVAVGDYYLLAGQRALEQPRLRRVMAIAVSHRLEGPARLRGRLGIYREPSGAPVDADGKPVFYHVPKSFEAAENDGQRWRWCLQQMAEMNPWQLNSVRTQFAEFLLNQFGVQTMAQWGWRFGRMETDDTKEDESGTYASIRSRKTRPLPGWPPASSDSRCPMSSITSRFFRQIAAGHRKMPHTGCTHCSTWPKSSRTGGSTPRRPSIGDDS